MKFNQLPTSLVEGLIEIADKQPIRKVYDKSSIKAGLIESGWVPITQIKIFRFNGVTYYK